MSSDDDDYCESNPEFLSKRFPAAVASKIKKEDLTEAYEEELKTLRAQLAAANTSNNALSKALDRSRVSQDSTSSTPTFRLDKLLAKPDKFDGDMSDSASGALKAQAWLQQIELLVSFDPSVPQEVQVKVAATYLSDAAARWWSAQQMGSPCSSFADFKTRFERVFLRDKSHIEAEAVVKLNNLRQGDEDVQSYARRFDLIMAWLPSRRQELATRDKFVNGLHLNLRNWLINRGREITSTWSMDELTQKLCAYDAEVRAAELARRSERERAYALVNKGKTKFPRFAKQQAPAEVATTEADVAATDATKQSEQKQPRLPAKQRKNWRLKTEAEKAQWSDGCYIHESRGHKLADCRTYKAALESKNDSVTPKT